MTTTKNRADAWGTIAQLHDGAEYANRPTPTAKQMLPAIGQEIEVRFESILVHCVVRDVKNSYGRIRLLIEPKCGSYTQWVEPARVIGPLQPTSHNNFAKRLEENL